MKTTSNGTETVRMNADGNAVVQDSKTGRATAVIVDGKEFKVRRSAKVDKL